jgi:hypothetical protein
MATRWLCPTCKKGLNLRLGSLAQSEAPVCPYCRTPLDPSSVSQAEAEPDTMMGCGLGSVIVLAGWGAIGYLGEKYPGLNFGLPIFALPLVLGFVAAFVYILLAERRRERKGRMVRFRYREATSQGWKAECWLWASFVRTVEPLAINVRLVPENKDVKDLPGIRVHVRIVRGGQLFGEADFQPVFQECATLRGRWEITYESKGQWGPLTFFPPDGPCWEGVIPNVFHSEQLVPDQWTFVPGEYVLIVEVNLDNGPRFSFDEMHVDVGPTPAKSASTNN